MQPQYWQRAWKKDRSILRRFGPTLRHSTESLNSFVARFTESLPGIRVSHSRQRVTVMARPIHDTFSRIFDELSGQSGLFGASSRTSAVTCRLDSTLYREAYSAMALELSREYSARSKSARAIDGNGCSFWPTAKVQDVKHATMSPAEAGRQSPCLAAVANQWPTPNARDEKNPGSPDGARAKRKAALGYTVDLNDVAAQWPTPAARDWKGENSEAHVTTNGTGRMHMDQLPNFVIHSFQPSRPDPANATSGPQSSSDGPNLRRQLTKKLNPRFVGWLMGFPVGWANIESTNSGPTAMQSYRSRQLWLLSRLLERRG
jgi:hypothetical protein